MDKAELKRIYDGAMSDDPECLFALGKMFADNSTFARITPVTVKRFSQAACLGHKEAGIALLKMYGSNPNELKGIVSEKDLLSFFENDEAVDTEAASILAKLAVATGSDSVWLNKAAELNDPEAACRVGFNALFGKDPKNPGVKDIEKATKNIKVALDGDIPLAHFCMALMYMDGLGVEKNPEKAIEYLKNASDKSVEEASLLLGNLYFYGSEHVEQNFTKAALMYRRVSDKNKDVHMNLSQALALSGEDYMARNQAIKFATSANQPETAEGTLNLMRVAFACESYDDVLSTANKLASNGVGEAEYYLGFMYANGVGVTEDVKTAKSWLKKASSHGYGLADKLLANL